jgi:hypothetical protein
MVVKGDDSVIFVPPDFSASDAQAALHRFDALGLNCKLVEKKLVDVEFCSSYVVPCRQGHVLVPKPGRVLAKTFWCKNTNYSPKAQQEQFAGILNGLKNVLFHLPLTRSLYKHPVYVKHFGAPLIQKLYNEYAKGEIHYDDDTLRWFEERYDLTAAEIKEMEQSLVGYPIRLEHEGFSQVITTDWAKPNYSDALVDSEEIKYQSHPSPSTIIKDVLMEEALRWVHPLFGVLMGTYESYMNGNAYNLIAHLCLTWVGVNYGFLVVTLMHVVHNFVITAGSTNLLSLQRYFRTTEMPSKRKRNNRSKQNESKSAGPPRKRRRVSPQSSGGISAYAKMLADPCNAELISGLNSTDEGLLARLKTTYSNASTKENGFILWDPTYVGGSSVGNCLFHADTNSALPTANSVAAPFGGANNVLVGATGFVSSDTVSDFRVVSACVRITYVGTLLDSKGIMASVSALPVDTFFDGQATIDEVASVDDIMALSGGIERVGTVTHEVNLHPMSSTNSLFKRDSSGAYVLGTAGVSRTSPSNDANRFGASFMGFAWKGVPTNELSFEFIQNIEWRPETRAGFVSVLPRQIKPPGYIATVTAWLDTNYPGWATTATRTVKRAAYNALRSSAPSSLMLL